MNNHSKLHKILLLKIKVIPNSKREEIKECPGEEPMIVKVRAPPVKDKANRAVIKLLSKHFNSEVRIISGMKSREKMVEVKDYEKSTV